MKGLLDILAERLAENIQLLSSFDKYKREVLGGNLDWGPMHTSEQFWRDNTAKLEEKDFQIIRVLLKLLETSRDVRNDGTMLPSNKTACSRIQLAYLCSQLANFT